MKVSACILTALLLSLCACRERSAPGWLLPGYTPGGTKYYPYAPGRVRGRPTFHVHPLTDSGDYVCRLVGDIHQRTGLEVLADSAGSLILLDWDGNPIWRKEQERLPFNYDLIPMDNERKPMISATWDSLCGLEPSGEACIDLILWNLAASEAFDDVPFDPYDEARRGMKIQRCCFNDFVSASGETVFRETALKDGLSHYRAVFGSDVDNDGITDYILRATHGMSASDRLSLVAQRGVLTRSEKTVLPVKGKAFLGMKRRIGLYTPGLGVRWYAEIPIYPDIRAIADFYGDAKKEILVSGYAPHNEVTLLNGTDKGLGYVYAFSHDGTLLWDYTVCGHFVRSYACIANVMGGRNPEVLVSCSSFYGDWGHMAVLDAQTGEPLYRRTADFCFLELTAFDHDGDGRSEWYTGSSKGRVYRFRCDADGTVLADSVSISRPDSTYPYANTFILASNDIDGDGATEVICVVSRVCHKDFKPLDTWKKYKEPELVVLSHSLREESRFRIERGIWKGTGMGCNEIANAEIVDIEGDGIHELVMDCFSQRFIIFSYY